MTRLRFYDIRNSRIPALLGLCQSDTARIASYTNAAQRRLLYAKEAGEEGWWNTWAEMAFNVSRSSPYITLPREVARIEAINVCEKPVPVQNSFYEYLQFGNGRMPKTWRQCGWGNCIRQMYSRNNAVTFTQMTAAPQFLTAYPTSDQDVGKKVLFQGLDADSNVIYSQDSTSQITGIFVTLTQPYGITPMTLSDLTGIQKDVTTGPVRIYQHDPNTGEEILLLTMQPSETTASYRRYYLNGLPNNCCATPGSPSQVQVTALVKLDLIPVVTDTDYCLLSNLEAITEECQSVRYSEMDTAVAKQMAAERHKQAIGLLNGELDHFLGKNAVAVGYAPFGSAKLVKQYVGRMM